MYYPQYFTGLHLSIYGELAACLDRVQGLDMELYSAIAGGVLAMTGGALAQWLTHHFNATRDRHKLLREKAEAVCEELEELIRWVTERRTKALSLAEDEVSLPPFSRLVSLQMLYFKEAADEVQNFGYKATAVLEAISPAHTELALAELALKERLAHGMDASAEKEAFSKLRNDHWARISSATNEFVIASQLVSRKIVTLVEEATRPR